MTKKGRNDEYWDEKKTETKNRNRGIPVSSQDIYEVSLQYYAYEHVVSRIQ